MPFILSFAPLLCVRLSPIMCCMVEPLFREIEHTADIGIEVEADTAHELFRRAGLALFSLMVSLDGVETREEREEMVQAEEGWEDLLHDWLSRLLHNFLQDGFI